MNRPTLDRVAAKMLADEPIPDGAPTRADRAASVALIREALGERARARARRRWGLPLGGVTACAAVVAAIWIGGPRTQAPLAAPSTVSVPPRSSSPASTAAFAVAHASGDSAFVIRGAERVPVMNEMRLAPKEVVTAGEGPLIVALGSGTKLDVEPGSELVLPDESATQIVALHKGAVTFDVAKLGPGERFLVRTTDAEVEVRGTRFRVAQAQAVACGALTNVTVTHGQVVVREGGIEHAIHAGDGWKRDCPSGPRESASPSSPRGQATAASSTAPMGVSPSGRAAAPTSTAPMAMAPSATTQPPPTSTSDLAMQNALFADAMASKRRGDREAAVASLDTLVERHPQSPLREAAEAERMKLLAALRSERAPAAARAYLARYPKGFAAAEATSILER